MEEELYNTQSIYKKAKNILSADVFSFIANGSLGELAIKRNRNSFDNIAIAPRVLRGLKEISTEIEIFQHTLSSPVLIAPAAYQGLLSKNGELDMLEAAHQFNTIMILSMFSSIDYAYIAQNKKKPVWLQMYFLKDREINSDLIQLAKELKFEALVVTVDTPIYAQKEPRNSKPLIFPDRMTFSHLKNIGIPIEKCLKSKTHFSSLLDHTISWDDLDWLADKTKLPIILKGIIDPRDTEIAIKYPNVKGIVISNHGGRQLNTSIPPMDVMQEHKKIAGNKVKFFLDGAIDHGSDIFKALAYGADATLIGRAALCALAVGGSESVIQLLNLLNKQLIETMTLCGCASLNEITPEFISLKEIK